MADYSLGEAVLGTGVDLQGLKKGLDQGERQSKSTFGKLGGVLQNALGVAIGVGVTKLPGMIMDVGGAVVGMVQDAAEVQQVSKNFDALSESIGATSDALLVDLRDATRGMVNDADLMSSSNKLISMGLADSQEQAAKLTEMATQLGAAMGQDATQSMEDFALMLANQSIPRLDTFGISSGKVRERIEELMKADSGLTREQAFMTAVMEEGAKTMAVVGEQGDSTKAAMDRIKATIDNTKLAIGNAFLPVLDKLVQAFAPIIEKVGPQIAEVVGKIAEWLGENVPMAIDVLIAAWNVAWPVVQAVLEAVWNVVQPIFEALVSFFQREGPDSTGSFAGQVQRVIGPLVEFLGDRFGWIVSWVQENWPLIQATVEAVMDAINTVITTVLGALQKFWSDHGEQIMTIVDNMWTVIKTIIDTTLKTAFDLIKAFMQLVTGDTEGFKETMTGIWERLKGAVVTIVSALWENIKTEFDLALGFLGDIAGKIWDKVVEVGRNIVDGLRHGIENAWEAFKAWLKQKFDDLIGSLLGFLGIHSPSSLFAGIGQDMMAGLSQGISGGLTMPVNALVGGLGGLASTTYDQRRSISISGHWESSRIRDEVIMAAMEADFLTAG